MNLHEAVVSIFPGCTIMGVTADAGVIEVRGSTDVMVPQNCEVLASGEFQYSSQERSRASYLLKVNDLFLMVRVVPDATSRPYAQIMLKPTGKPGNSSVY